MFKMKNLVVGMLVVGSLSMVGCSSTGGGEVGREIGDKAVGLANDIAGTSYTQGMDDADYFGENYTGGDVVDRMLQLSSGEDFNADEYIDGFLSVVDFDGYSDAEAKDNILYDYNLEKGDTEQPTKDSSNQQMTRDEGFAALAKFAKDEFNASVKLSEDNLEGQENIVNVHMMDDNGSIIGAANIDINTGKILYFMH